MNLLHLMIILAVLGLAAVPGLAALDRLLQSRAAAESAEIAAAIGTERPERLTIREHFSGDMNNFRGNGMPRN